MDQYLSIGFKFDYIPLTKLLHNYTHVYFTYRLSFAVTVKTQQPIRLRFYRLCSG